MTPRWVCLAPRAKCRRTGTILSPDADWTSSGEAKAVAHTRHDPAGGNEASRLLSEAQHASHLGKGIVTCSVVTVWSRCGVKILFNRRYNRIKITPLLLRIGQCEGVDDPPAASEQNLLIIDAVAADAREHKPALAHRAIVELITP